MTRYELRLIRLSAGKRLIKALLVVAYLLLTTDERAWAGEVAPSATVDVVANGVGRDETGATKDALVNAVHEAIGQFVAAETLVQNDQLVRDQILTYSDGFVEKYDAVGKPRQTDGGLVAVTIRATVRRSKLLEKVKAANISVTAVDGKSLFGEAVTKEEQRATATVLLAKEFRGAQQGLIKAGVLEKPTYDEKTRAVNAQLTVEIDAEAYSRFVQRLGRLLDQTATEQVDIAGEGLVDYGKAQRLKIVKEVLDLRQERLQSRKSNAVLVVCDRMSSDLKSSRWKAYTLAPDLIQAITGALEPISISVDLLDDHGEVVDSLNLPFNKSVRPSSLFLSTPISAGKDWVMIAPVSGGVADLGCWTPGASKIRSIPLTFDLTIEQLRSVASIRCTVAGSSSASDPEPVRDSTDRQTPRRRPRPGRE